MAARGRWWQEGGTGWWYHGRPAHGRPAHGAHGRPAHGRPAHHRRPSNLRLAHDRLPHDRLAHGRPAPAVVCGLSAHNLCAADCQARRTTRSQPDAQRPALHASTYHMGQRAGAQAYLLDFAAGPCCLCCCHGSPQMSRARRQTILTSSQTLCERHLRSACACGEMFRDPQELRAAGDVGQWRAVRSGRRRPHTQMPNPDTQKTL